MHRFTLLVSVRYCIPAVPLRGLPVQKASLVLAPFSVHFQNLDTVVAARRRAGSVDAVVWLPVIGRLTAAAAAAAAAVSCDVTRRVLAHRATDYCCRLSVLALCGTACDIACN